MSFTCAGLLFLKHCFGEPASTEATKTARQRARSGVCAVLVLHSGKLRLLAHDWFGAVRR